jgi:hypothetical protein
MRAPIAEPRILEEASFLDKPMVFAHPNDSVSSIASYPTFSQRSSSDSTNTSNSSVDDDVVVHIDEPQDEKHGLLPVDHQYVPSPPMRLQLSTRPLLLKHQGSPQPTSPTFAYPTPISIHLNNELMSPISEGTFSDRRSTIASVDSPDRERSLSQLIEGLERLNAGRPSINGSDDHSLLSVSEEAGNTNEDTQSVLTASSTQSSLDTETISSHVADSDESFGTMTTPTAEPLAPLVATQDTSALLVSLKPKRSSNTLPLEHETPGKYFLDPFHSNTQKFFYSATSWSLV